MLPAGTLNSASFGRILLRICHSLLKSIFSQWAYIFLVLPRRTERQDLHCWLTEKPREPKRGVQSILVIEIPAVCLELQ